jgi:hypothetical protein
LFPERLISRPRRRKFCLESGKFYPKSGEFCFKSGEPASAPPIFVILSEYSDPKNLFRILHCVQNDKCVESTE